MSEQGNFKGSQSATLLLFSKKDSKRGISQQQKRLREDIENPTFVTDTRKASAIAVQNALSVKTSKEDENKTGERLAFQSNFLHEKKTKT